MTQQKTLAIIGAGKVGRTLGYLWTLNRTLRLQDVLNRTLDSAYAAVSFIGAGRPVTDFSQLRRADIYLLTVPDDQIEACCAQLADTGLLSAQSLVFHCSGALASSVLHAAQAQHAAIASIHPICSFAEPAQLVQRFAGTACGAEGDAAACDILNRCFTAIGARLVPIRAESKILYHSAAVFASNYLVTLLDVASQAYAAAGIPHDTALALLEPLVRNTADNVFRIGPAAALTGPIARGDQATVERQYQAVTAWNEAYGALYEKLAQLTVELAARRISKPAENDDGKAGST